MSATRVAGPHAGHHQRLNRIDAHDPHRVDFLADGAGTQIGAHRRSPGTSNDENRHHGPDLRDGTKGRPRAGEVGGAEFHQQDVEDEHRKTVNGIESIRVGRIDTRAMNQV